MVLPELSPALLAGIALSFTRSLGEFGAVIFIAGNIAWKTEVTSLMIFIRLQEFDYPAASAIASVIPPPHCCCCFPSIPCRVALVDAW